MDGKSHHLCATASESRGSHMSTALLAQKFCYERIDIKYTLAIARLRKVPFLFVIAAIDREDVVLHTAPLANVQSQLGLERQDQQSASSYSPTYPGKEVLAIRREGAEDRNQQQAK